MRRTWEFGIRLAVGSSFRHIAWLVLREGFLLVFIGIAIGLLVTFASSRVLSSVVFGIAKSDISSYLIAAATQLVVVACGCLAVLRRITKLDPAAALKNR
jgi:ABC-type antimicrobial peptide transport system permease subunit